jgi:hypothetical protein
MFPLSDRTPLQLVQLKLKFMEYFLGELNVSEQAADSMADAAIQAGIKSEERSTKKQAERIYL